MLVFAGLLLLFTAGNAFTCTNAPSDQVPTVNVTGCTNIIWGIAVSLPPTAFNAAAPNLTLLDLTWLDLIVLPATQFATALYPVLTHLSLRGSGLTTIASGTFDNLAALLVVLIDNTGIVGLGSPDNMPPMFMVIMEITRFTISNNLQMNNDDSFTYFANVLVNLSNLQTFELHQWQFRAFPDGVFSPASKLTTLDISQNPFLWVLNQDILAYTPLLITFNASNNPNLVGYWPNLFSLTPNLTTIDMHSCALIALPLMPESATYLDVGSNQLTNLSGISGNLVYLDISWNPLTDLSGITSSVLYLDISGISMAGLDVSVFNLMGINASVILNRGTCIDLQAPYPICKFVRDGTVVNATNIACPIPLVRASIPVAIVAGVLAATLVPIIIALIYICAK